MASLAAVRKTDDVVVKRNRGGICVGRHRGSRVVCRRPSEPVKHHQQAQTGIPLNFVARPHDFRYSRWWSPKNRLGLTGTMLHTMVPGSVVEAKSRAVAGQPTSALYALAR